jgi:hypothetical protein
MKIDADVRVSDIMEALDMQTPPEGYSGADTVEINVLVDDDEAEEKLDLQPPETGLSDLLNQTDVYNLAAAIRRGDATEAELLLDRLAAEDADVSEWVQQGRYSRKARPQVEGLRKAA